MIGFAGLIFILLSFFLMFYRILTPDTKLNFVIMIACCCFIMGVILLILNIIF